MRRTKRDLHTNPYTQAEIEVIAQIRESERIHREREAARRALPPAPAPNMPKQPSIVIPPSVPLYAAALANRGADPFTDHEGAADE